MVTGLAAHRNVLDPIGWMGTTGEWGALWLLCRDEHGVVSKEKVCNDHPRAIDTVYCMPVCDILGLVNASGLHDVRHHDVASFVGFMLPCRWMSPLLRILPCTA